MLRGARFNTFRGLAPRISHISTTSRISAPQPKAPVDLDPSLQALLQDVDISIARHKAFLADPNATADLAIRKHRELEVFGDFELAATTSSEMDDYDHDWHDTAESRKSPAASFGSRQIGAVILPLELQNAITRVIEGADKGLLRLDAKRLFTDQSSGDSGDSPSWDIDYDVRYKNRKQSARHAERDGTAFASVALPSHYSAIVAVFTHLVHRLGPQWSVDRVVDWHAGTGSGLWAAAVAFQRADAHSDHGPDVSRSTLNAYTAIDRRDGLTQIGKRLLEGVDFGGLDISWRKTLQEQDMTRLDAQKGETLALSAFALSGLPSPLARKQLVKEMWESGADVIVLIDHNTLSGFESIAEAREQLLQMGRKELDNEGQASADVSPRGAYAVAPCPHDGACPLWHPESRSNKLVCGFSQRIQRPGFVRKTKHSGVGHEDIGYSYVVIKRGQRPVVPKGFPKLGRLGQVGKREIKSLEAKLRAAIPLREMEEIVASDELTSIDPHSTAPAQETPAPSRARVPPTEPEDADFDLDASLRLEANAWPRLVFPPLKRSGHVILDVCSPTGQILRSTIPKSQGKQPYYDARKSAWGDLFPHEPKNKPQARYVPSDGRGPMRGADIGKRGVDVGNEDMSKMPVYGKIAEDVKKRKKEIRRERLKSKWDADD